MERYLSRNASVGFVALAIACFCLIEIFRGIPWDLIEPLFGDKSDIYLAIVAAIVTIVGLPALGSIFDYLSNPFAQLLRQRRDSFSNMKTIGEQAKVKCGLDQNFDPISAFHLVIIPLAYVERTVYIVGYEHKTTKHRTVFQAIPYG